MAIATAQRFCGRDFSEKEIGLIQEVVRNCPGISRTELAHTVSELLDWKRPGGRLKDRECIEFLDKLAGQGLLDLPASRTAGWKGPKRCVAEVPEDPSSVLTGSVDRISPLEVELVESREQREHFRDLLARHHYLGYAMPFGARLQYMIFATRPHREVVACVQFSSPAWRMKARDEWIGWNDSVRAQRLQHVVNNSRLLILPRVRNLASMALSLVMRRLRTDWLERYFVEPLLVETLVDRSRFHGGCYVAANWILLGETSGRGRMDRKHEFHGAQAKTIFVRPLVKNAVNRLRQEG